MTLWLVSWDDLSVVTDTFEKAVAYVERETARINVQDSLVIAFDAKEEGYDYIGREYQYKYSLGEEEDDEEETGYITINEIEYI